MTPGFANEYRGQSPHFEVWFGKVDVAPGRALWFRYTIFDAAIEEASTWAVLFDEDEMHGGRDYWRLDELERPNCVLLPEGYEAQRFFGNRQVFHAPGEPPAHLDEGNAIGAAGEIEWDLEWLDSDRRFSFVPEFLSTSGFANVGYDTCFLDLLVRGEIRTPEGVWSVDERPGMVGHIRGSEMAAERWAWTHCNNFVGEEDAVAEGLTGQLGIFGWQMPPLSAFVVHVDGNEYAFRSPTSVVRAESEFGRDEWEFRASSGGAELIGRASAPDRSRVAVVEYDDTDGSNLWCYNSKLADLTLEIDAPNLDSRRRLRAAGTAAYEFMTRERPERTPLI